MNQKESNQLREYVEDIFDEAELDSSVFDFEKEIDLNLTYDENLTLINEKLKHLIPTDLEQAEINGKYMESKQIKNLEIDEVEEDWKLWERVLPEIKSMAVLGITGSGKTAFSFKVLDTVKRVMPNREIYVFKHPKPKLIEQRGFKNLYNIEQLDRLSKATVFLDEPQTYLKIYDHKQNTILATLLTLARQRDILLIMSTSMTQWFTRMLEGGIDCWICKDLDFDSVKQGSRLKYIIKENSLIDPSFFRLELDEYLFYCRKFPEYSRKHRFNKPEYFDEKYSKPYSLNPEKK